MKPRCSLNRANYTEICCFDTYAYIRQTQKSTIAQDFKSLTLPSRATCDCSADVDVMQQQTLCSSPSTLHLPALTHLTCRMQQPHTASSTPAHKTHRLSTIVTPDLWSNPFGHTEHKREQKCFIPFIHKQQTQRENRGSSFLHSAEQPEALQTQLIVSASILKGSPLSLREKGGSAERWRRHQSKEAKFEKVKGSTFKRTDLMLDSPSRIHAQRLPSH